MGSSWATWAAQEVRSALVGATATRIVIDADGNATDVFVQLEDGIAYVAEEGVALNDPGGSGSLAWVPARAEQAVIDAALACPGECIFIEMDRVSAA